MFSSESTIYFPADSEHSKLSACPTSKVPEGTDWSIHDFYNTVCLGHESAPSYYLSHNTLSDALYVISQEQQQKYTRIFNDAGIYSDDNDSLPDLVDNTKSNSSSSGEESDIDQHSVIAVTLPLLIESSSVTTCATSINQISFRTIEPITTQKKQQQQQQNSSFRSLKKSFMNSFRKQQQQQYNYNTLHSNSSSHRFLSFFKRNNSK